MKKILFSIIIISLSVNAHCQLITDSLLIDQHYRTFSYNTPLVKTGGFSLMFVMHGSGGSNDNMYPKTKNLEAIAGKEKVMLVYPNGYLHYWNECRKFPTF